MSASRKISETLLLAVLLLSSAVSVQAAGYNLGAMWKAPPSIKVSGWRYVDGGGFSVNGNSPAVDSAVYLNGKIYLAWSEPYTIDVAVYNGNDNSPSWNIIGSTINHNSGNYAVQPRMAVFNQKLYISWVEDNGSGIMQLRAAVYNGNDSAPTWTFIDGNSTTGLNHDPTKSVSQWPALQVLNSKLYILWTENLAGVDQLRAKVYNGSDSSPSWSAVDGGGSNGINYNPSDDTKNVVGIAYNNKLYAFWEENWTIYGAVYNGLDATPVWTAVTGAGMVPPNPNDGMDSPSVAISNGKLYMAADAGGEIWTFVYNGQDGTPVWSRADTTSDGLNFSPLLSDAGLPKLIAFGNQLYLTWMEAISTSDTTPLTIPPWANDYSWIGIYAPGAVRLSKYNGDDAAPAWTSADGNSTPGLNSSISSDTFGDENNGETVDPDQVVPVSTGQKLYLFWGESTPDALTSAIHGVALLQNTTASKLAFDLSAQTAMQYQCALTGVRVEDPTGGTTFAALSTTVSLSGTGASFYSDPGCTQAITSVNIPAGATGSAFYIKYAATGTPTISAAASGLASASQSETVTAAPFVWTGASGDGLWSTAANWSNHTKPGATDIAFFDGSCGSNCNVTIASTVNSVAGIHFETGYPGTMTQAAAITVGDGGFVMKTGTFLGATQGITVVGNFMLAGTASFTSTTGTLTVRASRDYGSGDFTIESGATFNANAGTVAFGTGGGGNMVVTGNSTSLYSVTFAADSNVHVNGPLNVTNSLTMSSGRSDGGTINFSGASVNLSGGVPGFAINFVGTGTQTLTAAATLASPITVSGGGTLQLGTSLVFFYDATPPLNISSGCTFNLNGHALSNPTLTVSSGATFELNGGEAFSSPITPVFQTGSTVLVSGTSNATLGALPPTIGNLTITGAAIFKIPTSGLTVNGDVVISAGTLKDNGQSLTVNGNFTNNSTFTSTGTETFSGNGSFSISGTGAITFSNAIFNFSGSTWTLGEAISVTNTLSITSGTLSAAGFGITLGSDWNNSDTFAPGTGTVTLAAANHTFTGSTTFYNLTLNAISSSKILQFQHGTTTTVTNNLTLAGTSGTKILTLMSDQGGSQFTLTPPASTTLGGFVSVQDSNSTVPIHGGSGSSCPAGSDNSGWTCP